MGLDELIAKFVGYVFLMGMTFVVVIELAIWGIVELVN